MRTSAALKAKYYELDGLLRRRFWQPLRLTMQIFHILPLAAAVIIFFIFADIPQLSEVYLTYLEDASRPGAALLSSATIDVCAAFVGLVLLSALLYAAHFGLSTMRINVIYSSYSDPDDRSRVRSLQRAAGTCLALTPWFGVAAGLLGLRSRLALIFEPELTDPQFAVQAHLFVYAPSSLAIVGSSLALGLAIAWFLDRHRRSPIVRTAGALIAPLAALGLFVLLTNSQPDVKISVSAGLRVELTLLAVCYGLANVLVDQMRPRRLFSYTPFPDTGVDQRARQRIFAFVLALLPWAAIAIACGVLGGDAASHSRSMAMIPVAMALAIALGLMAAGALDRFRESPALNWAIIASIACLLVVNEYEASRPVANIVSLYRWFGPLGSIAIELLLVIATLTTLAWLSLKSGFPAFTLAVLALVVSAIFPLPIWATVTVLVVACVALAAIAFLSRLPVVGAIALLMVIPGWSNLQWDPDVKQPHAGANTGPLCARFDSWLAQRTWFTPTGAGAPPACPSPAATPPAARVGAARRQPVFLIAVEGGGIYATAAASLLLAKLQRDDPDFSQHVFAISGVSGGAIGATIFQALDRSAFGELKPAKPAAQNSGREEKPADPRVPENCIQTPTAAGPATTPADFVELVSEIVKDDHLSPIVASIYGDFFGASTRRAETLAESFRKSVETRDSAAANELKGSFDCHWFEASRAPALVLNTTWVETGFRVVFAPFTRQDVGDASLYSFSDDDMPGDLFVDLNGRKALRQVSLIEAAVDSARFPGMLPAAEVMMTGGANERELWNFVDGGYSDGSGTATALALYRALLPTAEFRNVDLKIIVLMNSEVKPDLKPEDEKLNGTEFHDTLAPFDAVMKVRDGLSNEAIARLCDFINGAKPCEADAQQTTAPLQIVRIDPQTYGLALGWELSKTSFDLVSWMLGDAKQCDAPTTIAMVRDNSCALRNIHVWLGGN